jgi:hypothetical protein
VDPDGAFGWHCRILAITLVAAAVFTPLSVLLIGGITFALGAIAALLYYVPIATAARTPWRRDLDGVVLRRLFLEGTAPPIAVAVVLELTRHLPLSSQHHALAVKLVCALCITIACIVVSGALDWYLILPQLAGYLGARPCQSSSARKWRWVTGGWYLHRIVAAVATIGGPTAAAIIVSTYLLGHIDEFIAGESIAIAGLIAANYKFRLPTAVMLTLNPQVHVGDAVRYATFFTPEPVEGYVVDVSLEAVKVKDVDPAASSKPESAQALLAKAAGDDAAAAEARKALADRFGSRKETVAIPIDRIQDYLRQEEPFTGCDRDCSGINWYCKYNPQGS